MPLTGCATDERIPTYPAMSAQQSLAMLAQRSDAIHTVYAQGLVTLTRDNGDSVRMESVIILQRPGFARLRAWVLNQPVFDLTLTPEGLWVETPKGEGGAGGADELSAAGSKAADYTRQWLRLMSGGFEGPGVRAEDKGGTLVLTQPNDDGTTLVCQVERKTLTPKHYTLLDRGGAERFSLTLSRYTQEKGGQVWPHRIEAVSSTGKVLVELREVDINSEIPPGSFRPPHRAKKIAGPAAPPATGPAAVVRSFNRVPQLSEPVILSAANDLFFPHE